MKTILLLFAILFSNLVFSQIPVFEWAANLQWVNQISINSVTTDADSNVIATGTFNSWQDLDPGPAELLIQSVGVEDVFIMKLDLSGNLMWVKTLGSINSEKPFSIVTDSLNNVYVFGEFDGTLDLDPGTGSFNFTAVFFKRGFLLSLDPLGDFRWALQVPDDYSNSYEQKNKLAYTSDGGILLSENFFGTVDFDPGLGTFDLTASGSYSAYIWKLDLNGGLLWAKAIVGGVSDTQGVEVNGVGEIFVTGRFSGIQDFDPGFGTTALSSNGAFPDAFVLKLDANGGFVWVKTFGGLELEQMYDLAADDSGNVYVSGYYEGPADLDPGVGEFNVTPLGDQDNFVLKLDVQGDFVWALTYPFELFNYLPSLDTDSEGNVYIASNFRDSIDIAPGPTVHQLYVGPSNILTSNIDFYFCKLSSAGTLIWVKQIGGEASDQINGIHVAANSDIHVVGTFNETVDFNPGYGNAIYTSLSSKNGFNLKFSQCTQTLPVPVITNLPDTIVQCSLDTLFPPTAMEFCLGTIIATSDVTFPITTIGTTAITWTYDAGGGNVSTQMQNVIIIDTQDPVPTIANLADVSFICSTSALIAPVATDNCSGTLIGNSDAVFPILSNTVVTWTYDDGNGNTTSQAQNIIITPINASITQLDEITLTANASGYSYQWLDCDNANAPIPGETSQNFTATSNGNYAVEVSNGTCTDTSSCLMISDVSISEDLQQKSVSVYPNPTTGQLMIDLGGIYENISVILSTIEGQEISKVFVKSSNFIEFDVNATSGLYLLEIITENEVILVNRIIKI